MSVPTSSDDAIPLAIEPRMKWLVNNQRFADVSFLVGEEKQLIYGLKGIIAAGSPVLDRMFFADHELQITGLEPLEIPDLTSTGFINMLKYIYTNKLNELNLSELFETFVAGDKYQVYNMNQAMLSFIKATLTTSNCFIIYDQLMKFPSEYGYVALEKVKSRIRYHTASAFKSEHFVNISQETLVDVLKLDSFTIKEIDVLKFCAGWVDAEVKRLNLEPNAANKQAIFKPIKNWIEFNTIAFDQLKNFGPIQDLLSSEELVSLLLHHLNVSNIKIECNVQRKKLVSHNAFCTNTGFDNYSTTSNLNLLGFNFLFKARHSIVLAKIYTFIPVTVLGVQLSITDNVSGEELEMNYKTYYDTDSTWRLDLLDYIKIDGTKQYKFTFTFQSCVINRSKLSRDASLFADNQNQEFKVEPLSIEFHCLKKIDFYNEP